MKQQGFTLAAIHAIYLSDENGVIARRIFSHNDARQMSERFFEKRHAVGRPDKADAQPLLGLRRLLALREMLGKLLLPDAENTHTKAPLRFQKRKQPRIVIHANRDQQRF